MLSALNQTWATVECRPRSGGAIADLNGTGEVLEQELERAGKMNAENALPAFSQVFRLASTWSAYTNVEEQCWHVITRGGDANVHGSKCFFSCTVSILFIFKLSLEQTDRGVGVRQSNRTVVRLLGVHHGFENVIEASIFYKLWVSRTFSVMRAAPQNDCSTHGVPN